jgi:uncharacterized protein with PIN domain
VIVVDSSVIIAILLSEPDAKTLSQQIHGQENVLIAAPSIIEIMAVIVPRFGADARPFLDQVRTIVQAWIEMRRVYIFEIDYSFPIRLYQTMIQSDRGIV